MREQVLPEKTQGECAHDRSPNADAIKKDAERNLQRAVREHEPGSEIRKLAGTDGKCVADFVGENARTTAQQILVHEKQRQQEPVEISPFVGFLRLHGCSS